MSSKRKFLEHLIQNVRKIHKGTSEKPCFFSEREIAAVFEQFLQFSGLSYAKNRLERAWFRDELHKKFQITDDFLMDRIFRAFDKGSKGFLKSEDFVCGMSTFLLGNLDDQMQFCFQVYDLNSDGYISRDEMFHLLKSTLIKNSAAEDPDEGVKDLVERALKKLDCDRDGRVSYQDFKQAVSQDNLMLECLGTCLPNDLIKNTILQQIRGGRNKW